MVAVFVVFVSVNLYSFIRTPQCCDEVFYVGFPVPFYAIEGITGSAQFSLSALLLDVVSALGVALLAAQVVIWLLRIRLR